jgi:multidrug efflux system membrane fusion protein
MNMSTSFAPRSRRILALGAFSALAIAVLVGCSSQASDNAGAPPPPTVSAAPVLVKQISQWDEYKGDVLFTIDDSSYRTELARSQAELARARTQSELGRSEAARAKKLSELQAISTEEYEQRRAAADQAGANVAAAQAAVDAARLNLEWTKVRAPIGGRAGRALVTAGNLVSAGDSANVLTTLVSLDKVHVHFDADEGSFLRYAEMARNGQRPSERDGKVPVQIGLVNEDGFPHEGVVDFLDNQVDRGTGTIRARALLDNADRRFTPGLFARVRLLGSGQFNAMLIDDKAVLTDQDRKYVYVVDEKGTAQRRDVQLGRTADGLRIVEKGLSPKDRVIVSGVQKVFFPGMPVDAKTVKMGAAEAAPAVAAR